jgi:hypothetical protein
MSVKVKMNPNWSGKIVAGMDRALLEMTTDIHNKAKILAPVLDRNLVDSGVVEPVTGGYKVQFGSSKVPYARIQELGGTIKPKRAKLLAWKDGSEWRFAKSVTIKGTHYLARAGDSVARSNKSKYFKGKV